MYLLFCFYFSLNSDFYVRVNQMLQSIANMTSFQNN